MIMELVEGITLKEYVQKKENAFFKEADQYCNSDVYWY